jgi:hypothetical protein
MAEALDRIAGALERIDEGLAEANHRQAVK